MHMKKILLALGFIFVADSLMAQNATEPETRDLVDIIRGTDTATAKPELEEDKNYIAFLPIIGYAPANGFVMGAAMSINRLFDPSPTNLSSGLINFQLTSKRQFIVNARSKVYLDKNKWFLQGDWRFMVFTQTTYGLGVNPIQGSDLFISLNGLNGVEDATSAQDMKFNYIRLYEDAVRKIKGNWFVGLGYSLDYHFNIQDLRYQPDTAKEDHLLTSHHIYSAYYGFNTKQYITSGFNLNVLTDTRDNIANSYKGYYASLAYRHNPTWLGSSANSSFINYDVRYYLPLDKKRPRHVLAFWSLGQFLLSGKAPYLALPSIGWDAYNRSGRGYVQGRYRGYSLQYNEIEYRFPISRNGLLGGVAFVSGTFVEGFQTKLFHKIAPAGGFGLRFKMDKRTRVNITVDIAYGADNSSGIYFGLLEAF